MLTLVSVALLLAALAGTAGVEWLERRDGHVRTAARIALVGLALIAHVNALEWKPGPRLVATVPHMHLHDALHYHLGTRYFGEVGYAGLYHAVILADWEDARPDFASGEPMRDLSDNRVKPRGVALESAAEVGARFTPERWRAFKRDVAGYREAMTPASWRRVVGDHGYNGTPLVTAWLAAVAAVFDLAGAPLHRFAWLLDPALIGILLAFVWAREGRALALTFLLFFLANPLNDYNFVGASYLRYSYFAALGGALLALGGGRLATSGVLLAVSGWLRIFPLAIYGGLLLRDLAARDWRERLRSCRRLHAGFAVASLAILGGTSLLPAPGGRNPWLAFADNIGMHGGKPGINQVFLAVPLTYSSERNRLHAADGARPAPYSWEEATRRARRDRAWLVRGAAAVLLAGAFAALRRAGRRQAVVPCLLAMFCVLPMTHYHWAVLSLLPLVLPRGSPVVRALPVLFAALAIGSLRSLFGEGYDLQYAVLSTAVLAFLVFACLAIWRRGGGGGCDMAPG